MLKADEIKQLIDDDRNSDKKRLARVGQRYYEGDHDIKQYRMFYYNADGELVEDTTRSNERISHPFFTELADQLVAFILSKCEDIIKTDADGLQERLDVYFDEEFWAEFGDTVLGSYVKGFDYLYAYKNENDRIAFQYADGMGVVEVRKEDTDDKCAYYLYSYIDRIEKGKKEIVRIQIHTDKDIHFFVQVTSSGKIAADENEPINPLPNVITQDEDGNKYGSSLGFIPFFRLDYNRKQFSGLKPIKGLIDDYDLMECGLSNNLQDFDTPVHVVKGFEGDNLDELQQNIKTKKVVGVGEEGGIDVLTVDVPYEARKTKADEDEKNIYRFGMGLNTQGLKDTSATTNLAIQMAYTLLELKANKFITRIKKFLKELLKVVIDEINEKNGTAYTVDDVYFDFTPEIIVNETENIQNEKTQAETQQILVNTVLNVAAQIGDEEALKAICEILELDFEEVQAKVKAANPDDLLDAQNALANVGISDVNE